MKIILIGNTLCMIGAIVMTCIGLIKSKRKVLLAQCIQCTFFALGNAFLQGYTGVISNLISVLRNLVCFKFEFKLPLKITFILIQVIISAYYNNLGIIGWFPVLAVGIFTWFLDTESDKTMKIVMIVTEILWMVYDLYIWNFSSFVFDILTLITCLVGLFRIINDSKKEI